MALIEAHITKVEKEVGSDWGTVFLDHDSIKKVTTKRADLIAEAAQLKQAGVLVGLEYTEKTKSVDGRTYTNRYLENVGSLGSNGSGSTANDGIDIVQPQGRSEDPDRSWRICLQTGGKLAVSTLPLMPEGQRDFDTQKTIAQAWAEFFFFTARPDTKATYAPSSSRGGAYNEPSGIEQPPPIEDDAFPF